MIRNWVSIQSGIASDDIKDSTVLVGGDILDSFALVSLTALVEELVGRPLNAEELAPEHFLDLGTISKTFFEE
jgi:acyl carrier protein